MSDESRTNEPSADAPTIDAARHAATAPAGAVVREIGGFRVLGKLGEGGMGIVYEAEQQSPRRHVALKVVRGGHLGDEVSLRLFRREVETLARLVHPNIAALFEAGRTDDGLHFFTMELVSGRTLSAFARERQGGERPTTEQIRERLRLFATICGAVNYAHQRGVIHRDLKPSNVLVADSGEVKVLDFGLARITDVDLGAASMATEMGAIKGTLPYMSPEQARGDTADIDLRTDVYSLGVILYELLTGRFPYDTAGSSVVEAIRTICDAPPRPLRVAPHARSFGADLQTIVAKALEKEPDRRYQSAGALAEDVERYLANQPILAHPPSTMYQVRKLVARHKGRVAALGAIGVLLVALGITTAVQAERVRRERDRASAEAAKAEAINRFLVDALGAADPWQQGSRDLRLVDALHQAQGKAAAAFPDQPLIHAQVLQTLGTTFASLGQFAEADTALRASLALRQRAAGRQSEEYALSLDALADLYIRWARIDEGERFAREAVTISRATLGPRDPNTLAAMINLATACSKQAKSAEAKALSEEVLKLARSGLKPRRAASATAEDPFRYQDYALSVLNEVASREGDTKTSVAISSQRVALLESRPSANKPDLGQALGDLAMAHMFAGELQVAESLLTRSLEILRAQIGEGHPAYSVTLENLGNVYFREGRLDQTARILEQVLAARRKALGDTSEAVMRTRINMATVLRRAGDLERSERTYREAIPQITRKLGAEHPDVGLALLGLGLTQQGRKQFGEAEATLRRSLSILERALGDANPSTQRALKSLATLYTDWKKPAQAATYAARVLPEK